MDERLMNYEQAWNYKSFLKKTGLTSKQVSQADFAMLDKLLRFQRELFPTEESLIDYYLETNGKGFQNRTIHKMAELVYPLSVLFIDQGCDWSIVKPMLRAIVRAAKHRATNITANKGTIQ